MIDTSSLINININTSCGNIITRFQNDVQLDLLEDYCSVLGAERQNIPYNDVSAPIVLNSSFQPANISGIKEIFAPFPRLKLFLLPDNSIGIKIKNNEAYTPMELKAIFVYSFLYAIINGANLCFLHGCAVLNEDNSATVFFGVSGVGKTTTAQRFLLQGKHVLCDDQILLCMSKEGKISMMALPTWSRLLSQDRKNWCLCDKREEYPIKHIIRLARGETKETLEIEHVSLFKKYLWKELVAHTMMTFLSFPEEYKIILANHFMSFLENLTSDYSPYYVLHANLNFNIVNTLEQLNKK